MTDGSDPAKAASRIIRERAMAILRDTRSKIDPALLAAMKEKLTPPQKDASAEPALKQGVFKRDYKEVEAELAPIEPVEIVDENGMVPVDRQKIAQIVLHYMKNREDKQKH